MFQNKDVLQWKTKPSDFYVSPLSLFCTAGLQNWARSECIHVLRIYLNYVLDGGELWHELGWLVHLWYACIGGRELQTHKEAEIVSLTSLIQECGKATLSYGAHAHRDTRLTYQLNSIRAETCYTSLVLTGFLWKQKLHAQILALKSTWLQEKKKLFFVVLR